MKPTGRDIYVDKLLSNISLGYQQDPADFVADQAFPIINVGQQSGKVAKYNKGDWLRDEAKIRTPGTESAGGGYGVDTPASYFCEDWAYHKDITDEDVYNADEVFDAEVDATAFVTEKLRISRERRFATAFFGTSLCTTDLEGVSIIPGSDQFKCWDLSGSTPIQDIDDAKIVVRLLIGRKPNVLIVAERVHMTLKNHADVLDRYKHTSAQNITPEILRNVFELDKYLVAGSVYASSAEGVTDVVAYALNQYGALLCYVTPTPSLRRPSFGYTLRWNRPVGNNERDRLKTTIRRFRNDEKGYTRIDGSSYEDMLLLAPDAGVFLNNCVANTRTLS